MCNDQQYYQEVTLILLKIKFSQLFIIQMWNVLT